MRDILGGRKREKETGGLFRWIFGGNTYPMGEQAKRYIQVKRDREIESKGR